MAQDMLVQELGRCRNAGILCSLCRVVPMEQTFSGG